MAQYEFEVTEPFVTSHTYYVEAATRAEALRKVLDGEHDYVVQGDLHPTRLMTVRDVKRIRRTTDSEGTD